MCPLHAHRAAEHEAQEMLSQDSLKPRTRMEELADLCALLTCATHSLTGLLCFTYSLVATGCPHSRA